VLCLFLDFYVYKRDSEILKPKNNLTYLERLRRIGSVHQKFTKLYYVRNSMSYLFTELLIVVVVATVLLLTSIFCQFLFLANLDNILS
jgi:hypothetical protein